MTTIKEWIGKAPRSSEERIATEKCAPLDCGKSMAEREVGRLTARRLLHLENIWTRGREKWGNLATDRAQRRKKTSDDGLQERINKGSYGSPKTTWIYGQAEFNRSTAEGSYQNTTASKLYFYIKVYIEPFIAIRVYIAIYLGIKLGIFIT